MSVDEAETVRTVSGESPGAITLLKRGQGNPTGNGWYKTLLVMHVYACVRLYYKTGFFTMH